MTGKMPIPNDWDGLTWRQICVTWPDSLYWRGILRGLMKTMSYGRFWDGETGVIRDAQSIGRTILDSNFDFPVCNYLGEGGTLKAEKYWLIEATTSAIDRVIQAGENTRTWDVVHFSSGDECSLPASEGYYSIKVYPGTWRFKWHAGGYRIGQFGTILKIWRPTLGTVLGSFRGTESASPDAVGVGNAYSDGVLYITLPDDVPYYMLDLLQFAELPYATGQGRGYGASTTTAIFEAWRFEDPIVIEGPEGVPGPQGQVGATGPQGQAGPGVLMQADGSVLQWAQDDESIEWIDLIDLCSLECEPTPPEVPTVTGDFCEQATKIQYAIKHMMDYENKAKQDNDTWADLLIAVYGFYAMMLGSLGIDVATGIFGTAYELFRSNMPDWYGGANVQTTWDRVKCLVLGTLDTWGEWNEHSATLLRDWSANERDTYEEETDLYNFWEHLRYKLDKFKHPGIGAIAEDMDVGVVDCSGCAEIDTWGMTWDFTAVQGLGGWIIQPGEAEYVEGIGLMAYQTTNPWQAWLKAHWDIPATGAGDQVGTIDGILMQWVTDDGTIFNNEYGYDVVMQLSAYAGIPTVLEWEDVLAAGPLPGGYYQPSWNYTQVPAYPGGFEFTAFNANDMLLLRIGLNGGTYTPGTNVILRRVTVFGTGYNPFVSDGWALGPYGPFG